MAVLGNEDRSIIANGVAAQVLGDGVDHELRYGDDSLASWRLGLAADLGASVGELVLNPDRLAQEVDVLDPQRHQFADAQS
jgi:hypothetical protein